jgi:hypothetical protein
MAAILPLIPYRLQFPIPVGLNRLPGEHVLWRDIANGAVQTDMKVSRRIDISHSRDRRPLNEFENSFSDPNLSVVSHD